MLIKYQHKLLLFQASKLYLKLTVTENRFSKDVIGTEFPFY